MNNLIDILQRAGLDFVIEMADQEFYRRHFRPAHDLDQLETAQLRYLWAPSKTARSLEGEFGIDMLTARPTLAEQRQRPH